MKAPRISRRRALELETRLAAMAQATPPPARRKQAKSRDFDVRKFGAKGDGKTLDTTAFQAAIDAAAASSIPARVLVRGGRRYLLGSLELKGAIDFHLADDAELLISTRRRDYTSAKAFLRAEGADGLRLSGTGSINGRAKEFMRRFDPVDEWWRPKQFRPRLFEFIACHGLEICDFTFGAAPAWGLHLLGCEHVLVDNLKIRNDLDVPNCDGIDPDHCRDVEIRNCDIVCGDDGVVIKTTRQPIDFGPSARIVVKDCVFETQDSALKIGTETTQDIHDVRIERCAIRSSCRSFNIQLRDEGNVYNILVRDLTFSSRFHSPPWWGRGEAFSLTALPRTPESKVGKIHNVRLQNFRGRAENSGRV
ncbi:MAG TPA: glycosyl hydrolase family 28 protein, partial [Opitutales bacterium]|nr:glycosyl hydrolase family 28 protein [Opitutales bacterium]